jgi:hypothetical protein
MYRVSSLPVTAPISQVPCLADPSVAAFSLSLTWEEQETTLVTRWFGPVRQEAQSLSSLSAVGGTPQRPQVEAILDLSGFLRALANGHHKRGQKYAEPDAYR